MSLALARPLADPDLQLWLERAQATRAADDPDAFDARWGAGRIFVSIASFRDPECRKTLAELFAKAARPERIHVGLVAQRDPVEDADLHLPPPEGARRVRTLAVDWWDSRGVCWARFLAQALWRGEEFFYQIDSHMKFAEGWDELLVEEHASYASEKAILVSTPPPYLTPGDILSDLHPGIVRTEGFVHDSGTLRFGALFSPSPLPRSPRMPFLLAGAVFAPGRLIAEVPYDPYGDFEWEEVSWAVRLYTHGWDVYSGTRRVAWHQYKKNNRIKRGQGSHAGHAAQTGYWSARAFHRFNHLIGHTLVRTPEVLIDFDLFGLGRERTLGDFEAEAGVDFRFKRVTEDCIRARNIEDVETLLSLDATVLDDKTRRQPALVEPEELMLRQALAAWDKPRLATELVDLLIEIDRVRNAETGAPVSARSDRRETLIADFEGWDGYALACELAKLVMSVRTMNATRAAMDDENAARAAG